MYEEMSRPPENTRRFNLLLIVLLLAGSLIFYFAGPSELPVDPQFDDESMTLVGPGEAPSPVVIRYADILSVSEIHGLDAGTNLDGLCTEQYWFGAWRNDVYGEFTLCASPRFSDYIVLETVNGTVVFNYEDTDTTHQLYTALVDLLADKQQA